MTSRDNNIGCLILSAAGEICMQVVGTYGRCSYI